MFDDRDPQTARLECPACGARLDEAERRQMITLAARREDKGWRPTATPAKAGSVGYHLPAMITTLGSASLSTWVADWLAARAKGRESLRVFVNTTLAEGWEDRGAKIEPHVLMARRESYGDNVEVPAPAVAVTAGIDVQDDRFELQVVAWGPGGERWVVDWRAVPGDPRRPETHAALDEALSRRYLHASGHMLPIHAACIDTGFATEDIYDFVLARQHRRIYATKGFAGRSGEPIVGKPAAKAYGKRARPVRLYPINVDDAKAEIIQGVQLAAPGPGYMHFATFLDEEYFAQLCAERRETRYNKSNVATHAVWIQTRARNEALDTAVMALAAYRLLNPNIRQMAERLAATPPQASGLGGTPPLQAPPAPAAPAAPQPRGPVRSRYIYGDR
jgi:phage terminase large subunit GpA-like protein